HGKRLHAVLGLAPAHRPQPRTEPDEELLDLDPEFLRRDEMAEFVQADRHQDRCDEHDDAEGRHEQASILLCASARANRSDASTVSSVSAPLGRWAARTSSTTDGIPRKSSRSSRNAETASSLA